jgi:hypothetical protein
MVYILHFDRPYKHAKHYVGFCEDGKDPLERLAEHQGQGEEGKRRRGSRLMEVVTAAGIKVSAVTILKGDRNRERQLKRTRNYAACRGEQSLCSMCRYLAKEARLNGNVA